MEEPLFVARAWFSLILERSEQEPQLGHVLGMHATFASLVKSGIPWCTSGSLEKCLEVFNRESVEIWVAVSYRNRQTAWCRKGRKEGDRRGTF